MISIRKTAEHFKGTAQIVYLDVADNIYSLFVIQIINPIGKKNIFLLFSFQNICYSGIVVSE
jgi:hypothetical protein